MNLTGFKSWYQSLGVWGSLGTILVGCLTAIHVAHAPNLEGDLNTWSAAAGVVITGLLSLYGRIRATKQIGTQSSSSLPPPSMNVVGWFLLATVLLMSGCASQSNPPTTQPLTQQQINQLAVENVQRGFEDAQIAADLAYGLGAISSNDYATVQAAVPTVQKAIDVARDAVNGDPQDFRAQLQRASKALADYRAQRDAKKK